MLLTVRRVRSMPVHPFVCGLPIGLVCTFSKPKKKNIVTFGQRRKKAKIQEKGEAAKALVQIDKSTKKRAVEDESESGTYFR